MRFLLHRIILLSIWGIWIMKHLSNEPMKLHTTFRVGGPAEDLYLVETADEIVRIIDACEENDTDY